MRNESYSEKEAQDILHRAASLQGTGAVSRDELVRAAAEAGISVEALEAAEAQYQASKGEEDLKVQFRLKRRKDFVESLKVLIGCLVISYLLYPKDHGRIDVNAIHWFPLVLAIYGVWYCIQQGYLAFFERSLAWQKGFQDFKKADEKRKSIAATNTNDKLIAEIIVGTGARNKIQVIKDLRESTGLDLNGAKIAVDDYYRRHPDVEQRA